MIAQAWLNVAGLTLDFFGVVLLGFEWWTALSADAREAELEEFERRTTPSPMMPRPGGAHQAMHDHMRAQHKAMVRSRRGAAARGMRRGWFALAMVLVSLGFLLQIAGSFPGCCSFAGISPGGG